MFSTSLFINYCMTQEQAEKIAEYSGEDINKISEEELCMLLDEIIDNL